MIVVVVVLSITYDWGQGNVIPFGRSAAAIPSREGPHHRAYMDNKIV